MTGADGREVLLGIDGGNTKSIALVATPDGTVVGSGRTTGVADIYKVPVDEALARLRAAADAALAAAGQVRVLAAVASVAGADWPEDFDDIRGDLHGAWGTTAIVNDAIGALRAAVPVGPGVIVVCGTGAVTGARGADGRTWHSSFWQLDAQGAHELGVQALHAIVRAELGIGPDTRLTVAVLDALGEASVESLLHRLTGRATRSRREHSLIAAPLLDTAAAGDEVAAAIVRAHGAELGLHALAAARMVGIDGEAFPLALAGGVLRHPGRLLPDSLLAVVRGGAPRVRAIRTDLEPAAGALLLAFDAAGIEVTPEVDARLRQTVPAADLFDTHPAATR